MEETSLDKQLAVLESERQNYDNFWQDVAKLCNPRKSYITRSRTPGQKFDYDLYDSTGMQCVMILAAGLHSYLTNPASKWFTLRMQMKELNDDSAIKDWLTECEEIIYDTLNSSNFSQQIHEFYMDLVTFGTASLYEEEDPEDTVRFYARPNEEIFISENEKERVDVCFRKFELTARQAYELWKDKAGEEVKSAIDKKEYEKKIEFIHAVMPRWQRDASKKDSQNMPYASVYMERSKKHIIAEGGFEEFPFFIARFYKNSGEVYGTSPAMLSYSDIKMLNEMDKVVIRAAQITVDPPIAVPQDGYLLPIKWGPRAINYKVSSRPDDKLETLFTGTNIPVGLEMEESRRVIIKKNFFVDLFLLLADPTKVDMTATEVLQRVEEKMLILAPVLGRLMSELLDPLITRTFNILERNGKLPPMPPVLLDQDYKIEYTSPLARAQKMDEMKSLNNMMTQVSALVQVKPESLDKIDIDKAIDLLGKLYNQQQLIRDDKEVAQIRQQRQQQLEMQLQLENLKKGAEIMERGASANKLMQPEMAGAK